RLRPGTRAITACRAVAPGGTGTRPLVCLPPRCVGWLVDRSVPSRAVDPVSGLPRRPTVAAARSPGSVRRLRGLAAGLAPGRRADPAARPLATAAFPSAVSGPADRPATARGPDLQGSDTDVRPAPQSVRGPRVAEPARRGHTLHDPGGWLPGDARAIQRTVGL